MRGSKRRILYIGIAGIAVLCLTLGTFFFIHGRHRQHFSSAITQAAGFPLYWPAKLPRGWQIQPGSAHIDQGIVFVSVTHNADTVAFSEQTIPSTFDFNTFYQQGVSNAAQFDTDLGHAAVGIANGHPLGSVVIDRTWVLLSSTSNAISGSQLRSLIKSLQPDN